MKKPANAPPQARDRHRRACRPIDASGCLSHNSSVARTATPSATRATWLSNATVRLAREPGDFSLRLAMSGGPPKVSPKPTNVGRVVRLPIVRRRLTTEYTAQRLAVYLATCCPLDTPKA